LTLLICFTNHSWRASSEKAHIRYGTLQCDTSHFFVVRHQIMMWRLT
jgi:hypothetical protein